MLLGSSPALHSGSYAESSASKMSRSEVWMLLYFAVNLLLTVHNKWVLSRLQFRFPWTLTAIHIGLSGLGCWMMQKYLLRIPSTGGNLDWKAHGKMLLFSVLYAVNIAVSNVSLAYVSLAFHQLVRSSTPVFTIALELIFTNYPARKNHRVYWSLVPVVVGVCLSTVDEFSDVSFTITGLFLTILGVLLSAAKGIATNIMMVGPMKLHPLELIWRMSLPSVLQCLFYAHFFNELVRLPAFFIDSSNSFAYLATLKLLINGTLAMLLNYISFTANKKTSALAMTVAGNVKQALSIILAIYIFNTHVSLLNLVGVIIALVGGAWYTYESYSPRNNELHAKPYSYVMVQAKSPV